VSDSGRLIASGQVGTKHHKGNAAPVFLWMTETGQRITVLRGLTEFVSFIAFSEDERFLCGCGGVSSSPLYTMYSLYNLHYLHTLYYYL
jgi:hypothetical protein